MEDDSITAKEVGKATGGMIVLMTKIHSGGNKKFIPSLVITDSGIEQMALDNEDQITDTRFEDMAIYTTHDDFNREAVAATITDRYPGCRVEFYDTDD